MLYQAKTGEPVYCPIPPHVAELLRAMAPTVADENSCPIRSSNV
jgi:hypothetical protein